MPFAVGLKESLYARNGEVASEFRRGDSLEDVLDRHLLAVERMAETDLVTSILLLSPDGKRLSHGAGPNLPQSYRDLIDGSEIGPAAGSCGTAAFLGRPIYVADIATDPLWADYRHIALSHGLCSCWSTPIRDPAGTIIGTFAIYHRTTGTPTKDELEAIDMIAGHVAEAIISAQRDARPRRDPPHLTLVSENDSPDKPLESLLAKAATLERIAGELDRDAAGPDFEESRLALKALAKDSRKLAEVIRRILKA